MAGQGVGQRGGLDREWHRDPGFGEGSHQGRGNAKLGEGDVTSRNQCGTPPAPLDRQPTPG